MRAGLPLLQHSKLVKIELLGLASHVDMVAERFGILPQSHRQDRSAERACMSRQGQAWRTILEGHTSLRLFSHRCRSRETMQATWDWQS